MSDLPIIDPEFSSLIPALLQDEMIQLEENILADKKCRNALILWNNILVDGHNRYGVCLKHGIPFEVTEMNFADREEVKLWIVTNQLARRNLSDVSRIELALHKKELLKAKTKNILAKNGGDRRSRNYANEPPLPFSSKPNNGNLCVQTSLAAEANVSKGLLSQYQKILKHGSPELITAVKGNRLKIGTAFRLLPGELLKEIKKSGRIFGEAKDRSPYSQNELAGLLDQLISKRDTSHA
jgi:hypothetical protein